VRAERPQDRWFSRTAGAALLAGGSALGALFAGTPGAAAGLVAGGLAAAGVARLIEGRTRRLQAALALPFPEGWRAFLLDRYDHYERLPAEWRARFDDDLRLFLAEKRITGVGLQATQEQRVLVAASAVTLTLGWPDADWDRLTEVLLYPDDFDRDYRFGAGDEDGRAGETHAWGTVILSAPTLEESFDFDDDGYHVGLHEFAHLLDVEQAEFDGMPAGLRGAARRAWPALVAKEMERLRQGRSVLDAYGAEDAVEFFPVAVEAFFERPRPLRRRHAELYETLRDYFAQDPAAWDDARGRD
jgi:Mlc titration factor MtfA (ptsG expression regulator)